MSSNSTKGTTGIGLSYLLRKICTLAKGVGVGCVEKNVGSRGLPTFRHSTVCMSKYSKSRYSSFSEEECDESFAPIAMARIV